MSSIILRTVAKIMVVFLVFLSLFMLLRGHNLPGGGFIGGLLVASGYILHALAWGTPKTLVLLRIHPIGLIASGILTAALSGLMAVGAGRAFLTGLWAKAPLPGIGKISSVLMFDVGVYLVVLGTTVLMLTTLIEVKKS